ncbi:hypothetical protein ACFFJJ_15160 [Fictibacillus phosphorivorans]
MEVVDFHFRLLAFWGACGTYAFLEKYLLLRLQTMLLKWASSSHALQDVIHAEGTLIPQESRTLYSYQLVNDANEE